MKTLILDDVGLSYTLKYRYDLLGELKIMEAYDNCRGRYIRPNQFMFDCLKVHLAEIGSPNK